MIFFFKQVIFKFHVNFPGCTFFSQVTSGIPPCPSSPLVTIPGMTRRSRRWHRGCPRSPPIPKQHKLRRCGFPGCRVQVSMATVILSIYSKISKGTISIEHAILWHIELLLTILGGCYRSPYSIKMVWLASRVLLQSCWVHTIHVVSASCSVLHTAHGTHFNYASSGRKNIYTCTVRTCAERARLRERGRERERKRAGYHCRFQRQ